MTNIELVKEWYDIIKHYTNLEIAPKEYEYEIAKELVNIGYVTKLMRNHLNCKIVNLTKSDLGNNIIVLRKYIKSDITLESFFNKMKKDGNVKHIVKVPNIIVSEYTTLTNCKITVYAKEFKDMYVDYWSMHLTTSKWNPNQFDHPKYTVKDIVSKYNVSNGFLLNEIKTKTIAKVECKCKHCSNDIVNEFNNKSTLVTYLFSGKANICSKVECKEKEREIKGLEHQKRKIEFEDKKNDYHEYLKSDEWKIKREERLVIDKYTCVICKEEAEQVHHLTYIRVKNEDMNDLISVCRKCHEVIHNKDINLKIRLDRITNQISELIKEKNNLESIVMLKDKVNYIISNLKQNIKQKEDKELELTMLYIEQNNK